MISSRKMTNKRLVTFSPGWVVFLAWAKDKGIDVEALIEVAQKRPRSFFVSSNSHY